MTKKPLILAFVALPLLLAACANPSKLLTSTAPQQTTYTLRPAPETAPAEHVGAARIVEIAKPVLPPGFETDRIALLTQGGQKLDYFAAAKWPDIFDNVVQDTVRRSARNVLPYVVAVTPAQAMDPDYRLQTKINDFQPVYGSDINAAPDVRVSVEFTLVRLPENRIVSSFILTRAQPAESNRLDSIAGTLEKMFQDILGEAFGRLNSRMMQGTTTPAT